ncbi:hypothetical protein Q3G72_010191 [Acer saccharum]|nr:hypothetical protein Q3G72_010191 [Acer saccharum]
MTAYMQSNDQRANSHRASLKKMKTQLAQLLDAVVKQNKGKSPSTDEHINVLEVVEEEVEKVVRLEIIPNQVRVLDHSIKVDVDNVVKGTKNEEWEKGEDFPIKLMDPESFVIDVTIRTSPKIGALEWWLISFLGTFRSVVELKKKRSRVLTLVQAFEGVTDMKKGNHDCLNEQETIELEEDDLTTRTFEEIGELE